MHHPQSQCKHCLYVRCIGMLQAYCHEHLGCCTVVSPVHPLADLGQQLLIVLLLSLKGLIQQRTAQLWVDLGWGDRHTKWGLCYAGQ
jgi:hypothetical protein